MTSRFFRPGFPALIFFLGLFSPLSRAEQDTPQTDHVYRGVSHIHSQYSHDSKAPFSLILENARALKLDFVVITDHNSLKGREAFAKMHVSVPPLVIFGDEVSAADGHLIALGIPKAPPDNIPSQDLIDWIHAQGGYALLPHPFTGKNPWKNWEVRGWEGLEMYNFGHEFFEGDAVDIYLRSMSESNESILKGNRNIPAENFAFWDEQLRERKVAAIAGSDAHLKRDKRWFTMAMEAVTLYVRAPKLEEPELIEALAHGRTFIAFETQGLAKEFDFWAETEKGRTHVGEEIEEGANIVFHVHLPATAKIVLVHNGSVAAEEETKDLSFTSPETGAYRVEVYQEGKLWLFTNPIYVKSTEKRES